MCVRIYSVASDIQRIQTELILLCSRLKCLVGKITMACSILETDIVNKGDSNWVIALDYSTNKTAASLGILITAPLDFTFVIVSL